MKTKRKMTTSEIIEKMKLNDATLDCEYEQVSGGEGYVIGNCSKATVAEVQSQPGVVKALVLMPNCGPGHVLGFKQPGGIIDKYEVTIKYVNRPDAPFEL